MVENTPVLFLAFPAFFGFDHLEYAKLKQNSRSGTLPHYVYILDTDIIHGIISQAFPLAWE